MPAMDELFHNLQIRLSPTRYGVVLAATILCGVTDLWRFRVFNVVTIPLLISGLAYHAFSPFGERVGFAVVGAVLGTALLAPFCALGGVGAGDVKLLAGIGAWIGAYDVLVVFIVTGFLVGLYSLSVLAISNDWRNFPARITQATREPRAVRELFRRRANVDEVAEQDARTRRRRLAPMAALMSAALIVLMISQLLRETP
jgi:prepilin peptidase CpaA